MKIRIIQAEDLESFGKLIKAAIDDNYLAYGQMVITGLGNKQFMYTQQWVCGTEEEKEYALSEPNA